MLAWTVHAGQLILFFLLLLKHAFSPLSHSIWIVKLFIGITVIYFLSPLFHSCWPHNFICQPLLVYIGFLSFRLNPTTVTGNALLFCAAFSLMHASQVWPVLHLVQCLRTDCYCSVSRSLRSPQVAESFSRLKYYQQISSWWEDLSSEKIEVFKVRHRWK